MSKIRLTKRELSAIQTAWNEFPVVEVIHLTETSVGGIGTVVEMTFDHVINGIDCKVSVPITDYSDW